MELQYLGHAAFLLKSTSALIAIDPFITGNPLCLLTCQDIPKLDAILITHGHGDHLGDAVELAHRDGAEVVCVPEIGAWLSSQGVAHWCGMNLGGTARFSWGSARMVPALHSSSIDTGQGLVDGGVCCGFVVEIEGKRVYHAGDTCLTSDMAFLAESRLDLALLPVGGRYTMDQHDAVKALYMIKPRAFVPMPYDTFPVISGVNFDELRSALPAGVDMTVMSPLEILSLS